LPLGHLSTPTCCDTPVKSGNGDADISRVYRAIVSLVRGALPAVAVATLIPLALFYVAMVAGGVSWAIGLSLVYAYAVAVYQYRRRGRVSGMLLVTAFMATLKAVAAIASGQVVMYFAVPVVETAGFGLMFAATMFSSEPLVVRLARDLVPHAADSIATRRALIKTLSIVWTVTYLGSCATSLILLTTVPLPVFLGAHTLAGWMWTGSGMALTVSLCKRRCAGVLFDGLLEPTSAAPAIAA
jgi:MFS family permease